MLDRLSVLVQGIGFGLAAVTSQGFEYIAVEIPTELAQTYSYGPVLPPVKVSAKVTLKGKSAASVAAKLATASGVYIGQTGSQFVAKNSQVEVKSGAVVALVPVSIGSASGKLLATGKHDLSDEELAAMLLEILDAL